MTAFNDHPLRQPLSDLMHERTLPIFATPVAVRSWAFLVEDDARMAEARWLDQVAPDGAKDPDRWRVAQIDVMGGRIFERHTEFSTYLHFRYDIAPGIEPETGFHPLSTGDFDWLSGAAGRLFRSVGIVVLKTPPSEAQLKAALNLTQAVSCDVFGGNARIWTDFRMHDDGAGRIYVHDKGLKNDEPSRLLQTLIEIGHYRKLALLGFPVARAQMTWLNQAETRLAAITGDLPRQSASEAEILEHLMALSAEVEQRINTVRFRQGATEAYYRLTQDRLISLREQRLDGFSTMQDFIERRLQPAMRTCEATARRLEDLSLRIGRAGDLLRARISISLEIQNQDLLKSMNLRAKLQMKLSSLVEGLSVFAVSYYIFNLIKYIIDPLMSGNEHLAHQIYPLIIALILGLAWLFITHRKRSLTCSDPDQT